MLGPEAPQQQLMPPPQQPEAEGPRLQRAGMVELASAALAHIKLALLANADEGGTAEDAPRSPPVSEGNRVTSHASSR